MNSNSFAALAPVDSRGETGRSSRRKGRSRGGRHAPNDDDNGEAVGTTATADNRPQKSPDDRADDASDLLEGWQCSSCTFVMQDGRRTCSVCSTVGGVDSDSQPDDASEPDFEADSASLKQDPASNVDVPGASRTPSAILVEQCFVPSVLNSESIGIDDIISATVDLQEDGDDDEGDARMPSSSLCSLSFAPEFTPSNSIIGNPLARLPIAEELPGHEQYMYAFRVQFCPDHCEQRCPNDAYFCFDCHSKHPRRQPILISPDEYNYAPTRCRYILTSHGKRRCPQGDDCRYAHSTEEMIYHPLVYKTQLCPHSLSPMGVCTGFGIHCAKAHGHDELRHPTPFQLSAERGGFPTGLTSSSGTQAALLMRSIAPVSAGTDVELGLTRDNPAFYMMCYKTDRCPQKSCPRTCERYHNLKERRRCPKYFFYSEQPCPYVKSSGATKNWRDPSRCPDGDSCRYSHTLLEQMYHPNIYKTSPCNNFNEADPSRCTWGPLCTHAHGILDMQRQAKAVAIYERDLAFQFDSNNGTAEPSSSLALEPGSPRRLRSPSTFAANVADGLDDRAAFGPNGQAFFGRPTAPISRFSLPSIVSITDTNAIWQPNANQPSVLGASIWNSSVAGTEAATTEWKLAASHEVSIASNSSSTEPRSEMRSLLAKLEHLEVENARLAELSHSHEAELDSWRRQCQRLSTTDGCSACNSTDWTHYLMPCGHGICRSCVENPVPLKSCPVCQTTLTGIQTADN